MLCCSGTAPNGFGAIFSFRGVLRHGAKWILGCFLVWRRAPARRQMDFGPKSRTGRGGRKQNFAIFALL